MNLAEMRNEFDYWRAEINGSPTFDTTLKDFWLQKAQKRITKTYATYMKTKVIASAAQVTEYPRASVLPTLASGEVQVGRPSVQFARGNSAAITSVTDVGGDATINSAAHGLSDGDIIQIFDSSNTTNLANGRYTVDASATNTFEILDSSGSTVAYVGDATGVWMEEGTYVRHPLNFVRWQDVQDIFYNQIYPPSGDAPAGTLWLSWIVQSENLPAVGTDLAENIIPEQLQEHVPLLAARLAAASSEDTRLEIYEREWARARSELEEYRKMNFPEERVMRGSYKLVDGVFSYRNQTDRAFIFVPNGWI